MKFRATTVLLVATASLFAACSGSSSSDSRVKNEALGAIAPTITKIEPGDGSLTIFASLPDGAIRDSWYYRLETASTKYPGCNPSYSTIVAAAPSSFVVTGLTNGVTYTVRLAHWNGTELSACASTTAVPSPGSSPATVAPTTTAPIAPTITKIEPGDGSLTVFVTLPEGVFANTWYYRVTAPRGALNPAGNNTETVRNAPPSFTLTGLTNGVTYTISVAHWNNATSAFVSQTAIPGLEPPTTTIPPTTTSTTTTTIPRTTTTTSTTTTTIPRTTTTTSTTTTVAPTTTLDPNAPCRVGGNCAIGDIGPGGGVVFYDAGSVQPWGRYLEVAPKDLARGQFGCVGTEPVGNETIGAGFANSLEINLSSCANNTAAKAAYTYTLAGSTGWYLPSRSELNELCKYANNQVTGDSTKACAKGGTLRAGFSPTFYWSSTQNGPNLAWYQSFVTGQQVGYGKPSLAAIRPIRAFTNKDGMTVPTTIPAVRCDRGGECKVGDTGPGGGTVFYVAPTLQSWGQYMEITKSTVNTPGWGWGCATTSGLVTRTDFGSGPANTRTLVAAGCDAAVFADRYVSANGVDDWFLPSDAEAAEAARTRSFSGPAAWTSSADGCTAGYCFAFSRAPDGAQGDVGRTSSSGLGVFAVRMFKKVG